MVAVNPIFVRRRFVLAVLAETALLLLAAWLWLPAAVFAQDAAPSTAPAEAAAALPAADAAVDFAPGEILVGFYASGGEVAAAAPMLAMEAQVIDALDLRGYDGRDGDGGVIGQVWRVPPGREWEAIEQLRLNPAVAFAEPNWVVRAAQAEAEVSAAEAMPETPFPIDDTLYADYQWNMQRSSFVRAWQLAIESSAIVTTVRVAVIDSGVDFSHPDLAGRLLPGVNYVNSLVAPNDDYGHGTHVTGIIAALTNNNLGVMGGAPQVMIDPRKVLGSTGSGYITDLADAIREAADDGARVINMSLEIQPSAILPQTSDTYKNLEAALNYARAKGALLVAAGGNSGGGSVWYPARFAQVLAVAALTVDNKRPTYGPIGPELDIAAPGGDAVTPVLSLWPSAAAVRAKCQSGGKFVLQSEGFWYCAEYGTSMAAPHVTAAAALLMSMREALGADEARTYLLETARPVGLPPTVAGAGLLDAETAVRRVLRSDLILSQVSVGGVFTSAPYPSLPQWC